MPEKYATRKVHTKIIMKYNKGVIHGGLETCIEVYGHG